MILNFRKKGQMEMLGLAFVFVLIIFGFVIFLSLSNGNEIEEDPVNEYLEPKLASSTVDSILHLSVDCGKYGKQTISDLFSDCVSNEFSGWLYCDLSDELPQDDFLYGDYDGYESFTFDYLEDFLQSKSISSYEREWDSCLVSEFYMKLLLNRTLEIWGRPYHMEACRDTENSCPDDFNEIAIEYISARFDGRPLSYSSDTGTVCDYTSVRQRRARIQPLPLSYGNVVINFGICY